MRFGHPVPVPDAVLAALETLFGERIGHVRVIEYSLFARLHGCNNATTRRRRIYLNGSAADFFQDPSLMLHEYCHVLKQWEPGTLTVPRYVIESARRGYWNNRFEVEAREFADAHRDRLRVMLSGGTGGSPQERLAIIEASGNEHQQRADGEGGGNGQG